MKCLVLIVSVIAAAVFTVNCFSDVPEQPGGDDDKEQQLMETALTAHDRPGQLDGLEETYIVALEEHQKEMAEDLGTELRKDENNSSFWRKIDTVEQKIVATCKAKYDIEMAIDLSELELKIRIDSQTNNLDQILSNFTDQVDINITTTMDNSIANLKDDVEMKIDTLELELKATIANQTKNMDDKIDNLKDDIDNNHQTAESQMVNMTDTLEWIVNTLKGLRCSLVNGFLSPTEDQCFIYSTKDVRITLEAANTYCITRGLQLAEIENHNALWLRKHVIELDGGQDWAWTGGRGNGSNMIWPHKQEILSSDNSLWWSGYPGGSISTNHIVLISIHAGHLNSNPNNAYLAYSTGGDRPFICELV